MLLVLLLGAAGFGITHFAVEKHTTSQARQEEYALRKFESKQIKGGANSTTAGGDTAIGDDLIADDGVVGNPKKYPASACELPDYQSKNGKIYAVSKNGTEVPIGIKGINWFGMETGQAIPFGLWDNTYNGTTAVSIFCMPTCIHP